MITDAQLATAATPAQYEAAKQELERLKKLYGDNLKICWGELFRRKTSSVQWDFEKRRTSKLYFF